MQQHKSLLKEGDRVKVREDLVHNCKYGNDYFIEGDMGHLRGKVVTIETVSIDLEGETKYFLEDCKSMYCWTEEMFEKQINSIKKL